MEKKQKVLLVHNGYQIPGGEDTAAANEKKLLEAHGHEVVLYNRYNGELKDFSLLRKLCLPFTTIFNPRTDRDIKRIIRQEKIDIVHVHNTLNLISPAVYYAARACGVPVVQTVHNFRLLCPGATFYRDGHICEECLSKGLGCAVKHSCYRGSRVQTLACVISTWIHRLTGIYGRINYICLTEFNREKLLNLKQIPPERVFVKPNFAEAPEEAPMPYEERENQFVFAGRLDQLKGIGILLEAWKQMGEKAPVLLVCGKGPMEDQCRKFIAQHHLDRVKLLGFLPNQEVRRLIGRSRALILPTQWYEGFPMTIVEAFSVGTPVLCSDLGNAGSVVQEGVTGFKFQADQPESICAAADRLLGFPEIGRTTSATYENSYTEKKNYQLLQDIYQAAR